MEKHILKESWYSRVIVGKINLKGKNLIRVKNYHKKIIKGIINQDAIIIPNQYASNSMASKYIDTKYIDRIQGENI